MKKIIFLFFVIILFFSCPSEIVKKTNWRGELKSNLNDPLTYEYKHDIEFFIRNDTTMRVIVEVNIVGGEVIELAFDGTYYLNSDYVFEATLEDDDENMKIDLEGILNTSNNNGYGDLKWEWANGVKDDGEWEVTRFY